MGAAAGQAGPACCGRCAGGADQVTSMHFSSPKRLASSLARTLPGLSLSTAMMIRSASANAGLLRSQESCWMSSHGSGSMPRGCGIDKLQAYLSQMYENFLSVSVEGRGPSRRCAGAPSGTLATLVKPASSSESLSISPSTMMISFWALMSSQPYRICRDL